MPGTSPGMTIYPKAIALACEGEEEGGADDRISGGRGAARLVDALNRGYR